MSGTVLIRGARQLLTLRGSRAPRRGAAAGELGIASDGAVLIEDGTIVEVGPSRRVENLAQARRAHEVNAAGCVVMPGFVDCHTHVVSGITRPKKKGGSERGDAESEAGCGPNISAARLRARAQQYIEGMARHGTTTLEARSGYGVDETTELKILKVQARLNRAPLDVVPTFMSPRAIPRQFPGDSGEYVSWLCGEFIPRMLHRRLARFADFRCSDQVLSLNDANCYLEAIRDLGFPLKVHAGNCRTGEAVRLAVALDAISIDHLEDAAEKEIELLGRSKTVAVLLPGCTFSSGRPIQPIARRMIDAGVAVGAATNFNPCTSPAYSMQAIVALACAQLGMTPAEAICAATMNAACAIGLGQEAGSIETGKWGDVIVLDVSDYRDIPRCLGVNLVRVTVKRGDVIYQRRRNAQV